MTGETGLDGVVTRSNKYLRLKLKFNSSTLNISGSFRVSST